MQRFLALARVEYGSLAEYVVASGLPARQLDALRAELLA